jgi:D-glycero-alpha-D-manno-heptose-7-phosphate kinase
VDAVSFPGLYGKLTVGVPRSSLSLVTSPLSTITATAPIRVCDNGGWTDTWFAQHGQVFNIAVSPLVQVSIDVYPRETRADRVTIHARNFGDRYSLPLEAGSWLRHPLLEASIVTLGVPEDAAIHVTVGSDAPAGASVGTSASVAVALVGALDALRNGNMDARELAYAAHRVEMEVLGWQCGIQDQLAAAYGGINFIEMRRFPEADVMQLQLADDILDDLERRLVLVYLGASHRSSDVHHAVIRELEHEGPGCRRLDDLRHTATRSRDALLAGDLDLLGAVMIDNTEAQRRLHPGLVGSDAQRVIEVARAHRASGWKVNGAGGEGGSVTVLLASGEDSRASLVADIARVNPSYRLLPTRLAPHGVGVRSERTADRGTPPLSPRDARRITEDARRR